MKYLCPNCNTELSHVVGLEQATVSYAYRLEDGSVENIDIEDSGGVIHVSCPHCHKAIDRSHSIFQIVAAGANVGGDDG